MIMITVNDASQEVSADTKVSELLQQLGYQNQAIAIAINETFVPRSQYDDTALHAQDKVEIVAPMQGG